MDTNTVLEYLNDFANTIGFPLPDINTQVADMRMTVFRSEYDWALIFEVVEYNPSIFCHERHVSACGSCLPKEEWPISRYAGSPFEFPDNSLEISRGNIPLGSQEQLVAAEHFTVVVNGVQHEFSPTPQDYHAAGISPIIRQDGVRLLDPPQLLRFLCHALDHAFFLSDDCLRYLLYINQNNCQSQSSHFFTKLLQTRHWHHPDPENNEEEDDLRQVECFQILARTIASGDLTEWLELDPATFNTHWSHWQQNQEMRNRYIADAQSQGNVYYTYGDSTSAS